MFNRATKDFCKQLKIKLPIIQAPMAGGIVSPALVSAVATAGGLATLPLGYLSFDAAQGAIRETASLTSERFAVNIFIPAPVAVPSAHQLEKMLA